MVTLCASFRIDGWQAHFFMLSIMMPFYFSHWEEWHTGKLILSAYGNPTEAQLGMCLVHLITFFNGPQWWDQTWISVAYRWFPFFPWNTFEVLNVPVHLFVGVLFGLLAAFAVADKYILLFF